MPRPHPPEFRRRAVELARQHAKPMAKLARDLGISETCLRNWMAKANIDEGHHDFQQQLARSGDGLTYAVRRISTASVRPSTVFPTKLSSCSSARPGALASP